jgi:hypothetical protein
MSIINIARKMYSCFLLIIRMTSQMAASIKSTLAAVVNEIIPRMSFIPFSFTLLANSDVILAQEMIGC